MSQWGIHYKNYFDAKKPVRHKLLWWIWKFTSTCLDTQYFRTDINIHCIYKYEPLTTVI